MPENDENAVFTEVLSVDVDLASFQAGLDKLSEAYQSWLEQLSSKGINSQDIINTGSIGAIADSLNTLIATVNQFGQAMGQSFGDVFNSIQEQLSKLDDVAQATLTRTAARGRRTAQEVAEGAEGSGYGEEGEPFEGTARSALGKGRSQITAVQTQEDAERAREREKDLRDAEDEQYKADEEWAKNLSQRYEAHQKEMAKEGENIFISPEEERSIEAQTQRDAERQKEREREYERRAQMSQEEMDRSDDEWARALGERQAAREKAAGSSENVFMSPEDERNIEFQTQRDLERFQQSRGYQPEQEPKQEGFFQQVAGGFTQNLGTSLGRIARIWVEWQLVNGVMALGLGIVKGISDQFKDGVNYLSDMKDRAAELQGILASTVKNPGNQAQQWNTAGEQSIQTVKALQDAAIKIGVPFKQLFQAFQEFEQFGGQNFVSTLQQAVNVSTLLVQAVHASGAGYRAQLDMLKEIPGILSGQIPVNSTILAALHMSNDEWTSMLSKAKQGGDLYEMLAEKAEPYLNVQQQATLRQSVLNENISQSRSRIMAAFVDPSYERYLNFLKEANDLMVQHRTGLQKVAHMAGEAFLGLFNPGAMLQDAYSNVPKKDMLNQHVQAGTPPTENPTNALKKIRQDFDSEVENIHKRAADEGVGKSSQGRADIAEAVKMRIQDLVEEYTGKAQGTPGATGLNKDTLIAHFNRALDSSGISLDHATDAAQKEKAREALTGIVEQYHNAFNKIKEDARQAQEVIQGLITANKISVTEAAPMIAKTLQTEGSALNEKIIEYTRHAKESGAPQTEVQRFIGEMANTRGMLAIEATTTNNAAERAAVEEKQNIRRDHFKAEQHMTQQHARAMLEITRQQESEGMITHTASWEAQTQFDRLQHRQRVLALHAHYRDVAPGSREQAQITNQLSEESARYTDQLTQSRQAGIKAHYQDKAEAIRQYKQAMDDTIASQRELIDADKQSGASAFQLDAENRALISTQKKESEKLIKLANDLKAWAQAHGYAGTAIEVLTHEVSQASTALQSAKDELNTPKRGSWAEMYGNLFGTQDPWGKSINSASEPGASPVSIEFQRMAVSAKSVTTAFDKLGSAVQPIVEQTRQGNVLGGVGTGMSTLGSAVGGPWGEAIAGIGSAFSIIGNLLTAQAQHIAQQMGQDFNIIMMDYSNGTMTLQQTLQAAVAQEEETIQKLSGKKGGQQQLNQLLPQMESAIDSLKQQIDSVTVQMDDQVSILKNQTQTMQSFYQQWVQINQQVNQFLQAGGSAAQAMQYISESLQQILITDQNQLTQAQDQAVQTAIQLNQLLFERNQMQEQELKTEFDIVNADALERQESGAIVAASQLAQQRQQYQNSLININAEISLDQSEVAAYQQIFQIASNLYDLNQQNAQLQVTNLDYQIAGYKDLQNIVESINQTNGVYGVTGQLGNNIGQLVVQIMTNGTTITADDVANAINKGLSQANVTNAPTVSPTSLSTLLSNASRYGTSPVMRGTTQY